MKIAHHADGPTYALIILSFFILEKFFFYTTIDKEDPIRHTLSGDFGGPMKKFYYFLCLTLSLSFLACSSGSDPAQEDPEAAGSPETPSQERAQLMTQGALATIFQSLGSVSGASQSSRAFSSTGSKLENDAVFDFKAIDVCNETVIPQIAGTPQTIQSPDGGSCDIVAMQSGDSINWRMDCLSFVTKVHSEDSDETVSTSLSGALGITMNALDDRSFRMDISTEKLSITVDHLSCPLTIAMTMTVTNDKTSFSGCSRVCGKAYSSSGSF
jgi:hypothetical protein